MAKKDCGEVGKKGSPPDASSGEVVGLSEDLRHLAFSRESRRPVRTALEVGRWPGATLVDHLHPAERVLASTSQAGLAVAALLSLPVAWKLGLGIDLLRTVWVLWVPGALAALGYFLCDVLLVADPVDRVLREVLVLGPLAFSLRVVPATTLEKLRLEHCRGYTIEQRTRHSPGRQVPFDLRLLEGVTPQGEEIWLTGSEEAGPENEAASRAVADALGLELEVPRTWDVGHCARVPGRSRWAREGRYASSVAAVVAVLLLALGVPWP